MEFLKLIFLNSFNGKMSLRFHLPLGFKKFHFMWGSELLTSFIIARKQNRTLKKTKQKRPLFSFLNTKHSSVTNKVISLTQHTSSYTAATWQTLVTGCDCVKGRPRMQLGSWVTWSPPSKGSWRSANGLCWRPRRPLTARGDRLSGPSYRTTDRCPWWVPLLKLTDLLHSLLCVLVVP